MESLRLVVCGRPECRRLFQLCSRCDRGQRYCERRCGVLARAESVRAAGRRYQRTRDGRHAHAERQAAYRGRRRKVTHQSPPPGALEVTVPPAPAQATTQVSAEPSAARPPAYAPPSIPACTSCGRANPFLRHTTLARTRMGPRWRRYPA
ncbi:MULTISPECIES: hypothetical protein [Myxococcus]|uniref:hypothetical protein n=1 Tax=Myxococcus TaxID=32 RepID=UPI00142F2BEF|nr:MULTISPECIES: hypothetical protein [Myxococcus]NOJ58223.1 hypothetical protein [Myxococcus xanthus]QPM83013.1 hypothetical protein I5Q59_17865 [Myxococcus xanthus]QVW65319.1 hypothetical protein JTM82_23210 [Myxococcus xanthus DZ2]UEO01614.1 hypothetical protein K1515_19580 [Myxococcus xanthus DZ2]UYI18205.1 hypothetical protein N3T43_18420 [Myxococcus xanthus]